MRPKVVFASVWPKSMSALSVCNGTRPSRFHSTRAISEPPRRPLTRIFTPWAPARIVFISDCLMARRKAIRFSSWAATFSATSWAASSGFLISWIVTRTRFPVIFSSSSRSWSTLVPPLPMTMPGLAVCSGSGGRGRPAGGRLRRSRQGRAAALHDTRAVFDDGGDMAGALEDAEQPAHGAGLAALQHRTRLDPDVLDHQVILDQVEVVLGIRLGGADHFGHVPRGGLGHEGAGDQRLTHRQVAQRPCDESHFPRRSPDPLGLCLNFHHYLTAVDFSV